MDEEFGSSAFEGWQVNETQVVDPESLDGAQATC